MKGIYLQELQKSDQRIKPNKIKALLSDFKKDKILFLLVLPGVLYFIIFAYLPMFGIIIAFQDYRVSLGFLRSHFVGLKHFIDFFSSEMGFTVIKNTLLLNLYSLIFTFPVPIIFAISLSEVRSSIYRKAIQTVSYLPYFISTVITIGIVNMILSSDVGALNIIREMFGLQSIDYLTEPQYYRTIYVITTCWKSFGWSAIIYLAAILGIDTALFDAARIDGATKMQRILYITLPCINGTIMITLILNVGAMFSSNFDMSFLLNNPLVSNVAEVISTYVYKRGVAAGSGVPDMSFATAVGLFQSVVNFILLIISNSISRKYSEVSLY